ncbi:hypothetical protein C0063_17685 [Pseudoxanthomonas sp. KAs_5_3]|nr:hypothetical protein C0063_17685 [Pseudoxanthomonas sp. KAs_5_3]
MARKRKKPDASATYCRSYLVTLGLVLAALGVLLLVRDGEGMATWPWWGSALLAAFLLGGTALALFGLLGPSSKMQGWAEASSSHEASLFIMTRAYPVYLVLSLFYDRR